MKTEHILVIRFSAMGDVAMTVPVVYSLAKQYPHVRITVLSRPFARPFFENLSPNVGFMEADLKGEYKGVKGLNALYRRLIAKQFTAIADLHSVLRSTICACASTWTTSMWHTLTSIARENACSWQAPTRNW